MLTLGIMENKLNMRKKNIDDIGDLFFLDKSMSKTVALV